MPEKKPLADTPSPTCGELGYRELVDLANCVILRLNAQGEVAFLNEFGARFFGFEPGEVLGRSAVGTIIPEVDSQGARGLDLLERLLRDPDRYGHHENENVHKSGRRVWMAWINKPLSENGTFAGLVCIGSDITPQVTARDELLRRERYYTALIERSSDLTTIIGESGVILYESPAIRRILGFDPGDAAGKPLVDLVHPEDQAVFRAGTNRVAANGGATDRLEFRRRHRNGAHVWLEAQATNFLEDKAVAGIVLNCRDVSERRRFEEEMRRQVFLDHLTGLPNRALVLDRIEHALERSRRRSGYQFAVLLVDLDRFKVVNESLGHAVGDRLLRKVGGRLLECVRKVDTVARLGGDEFLLLLEDIDDDREAIRVAERILSSLARPFAIEGQEVFTSASIGIVYSAPEYDKPGQVVRDADTAMYKAKAGGKGRYRVFHSKMHKQALALLEMETDMRKALQNEEFEVHYQPIHELATNRVVGMEALLRWRHPVKGLIAPGQFIPLAEETGLILPLGEWVLRRACAEMGGRDLSTPEGAPLGLAVNLSPFQMAQPGLAGRFLDILAETGFDPRRLKLEITESALMDNPQEALALLTELKAGGLQLALDDFGTGYSSLSTLHSYPFDTLKIDRSFIGRLGPNGDRNSRTVQTIIAFAANLGMNVVAEGIEASLQLARLREFNCRFGQGFLLGRPVPIDQIVQALRAA
jgi:diguanylate cyclase (GGDEF)-like protein/PAS domain S-box-containing protein